MTKRSWIVSTITEAQTLKQAHRRTWASGEYPRIAELVTAVGERVVEAARLSPGADVLDVAAGSGNAAIPAALTGARVVAADLTPELFDSGRRRAEQAGVEIEWVTADAEELPFGDARFDCVLSSLGVQFAPRHELVARELVRVCRPGGSIVLGNWAADGYIGRFWTVMGPYLPACPSGLPLRRGGVASSTWSASSPSTPWPWPSSARRCTLKPNPRKRSST